MAAYNSIEDVPSRYELVHVIARRARKLQSGARPMLTSVSRKPTRIAQHEAMSGLIQYTNPVRENAAAANENGEGAA